MTVTRFNAETESTLNPRISPAVIVVAGDDVLCDFVALYMPTFVEVKMVSATVGG